MQIICLWMFNICYSLNTVHLMMTCCFMRWRQMQVPLSQHQISRCREFWRGGDGCERGWASIRSAEAGQFDAEATAARTDEPASDQPMQGNLMRWRRLRERLSQHQISRCRAIWRGGDGCESGWASIRSAGARQFDAAATASCGVV